MTELVSIVADDLDFYALIEREGSTLVVFGAPGCGACRRAKVILPRLGDVVERVIEVSAERSPGLVADLEIFHLPAFFLYVDGAYHAPIEATLDVPSLSAAIIAARRAAAQEPP